MVKCGDWSVGICSWSLSNDIGQLAEAMRRLQVEHIHLAIAADAENPDFWLAEVRKQGWVITAGMIGFSQEDYSTLESIRRTGGIVPDDYWDRNRELFALAADMTARLGVKYLSMHAGFLDESDAEYARKFTDRVRACADIAAEKEIMVLLETGQETAEELADFLEKLNHPAVGVNFDPGNMILYGKGEPAPAVRALGHWMKHVHIKDAVATERAGTWGTEVPWGEGEVGQQSFLQALKEIDFAGAMAIEREAGEQRFEDMRLAIERLQRAADI